MSGYFDHGMNINSTFEEWKIKERNDRHFVVVEASRVTLFEIGDMNLFLDKGERNLKKENIEDIK